MDQRTQETEYEAPLVEDVETVEGPASLAAGQSVISLTN
jgi:hypothetical protein